MLSWIHISKCLYFSLSLSLRLSLYLNLSYSIITQLTYRTLLREETLLRRIHKTYKRRKDVPDEITFICMFLWTTSRYIPVFYLIFYLFIVLFSTFCFFKWYKIVIFLLFTAYHTNKKLINIRMNLKGSRKEAIFLLITMAIIFLPTSIESVCDNRKKQVNEW